MKFFRRKKKSILPKSHFMPIFSQQADFLVMASDALEQMFETTDKAMWKKLEKDVKQYEIQGDALLAEFYEQIYETFVPVIDRDDIQIIAMDIDIFLDHINASAKSLLLYLPEKIDQELIDMSQYIRAEADALRTIVSLLEDMKHNFNAISLQCERITELEHAADEAYEEYIGAIFRNEKNAIELMKYKNIAEVLEDSTDAAKKVSDHIRKLLIRYL